MVYSDGQQVSRVSTVFQLTVHLWIVRRSCPELNLALAACAAHALPLSCGPLRRAFVIERQL